MKTQETCCGRWLRSAVCDKRGGGAEEGSARVGGRKSASRVTAERRLSESGWLETAALAVTALTCTTPSWLLPQSLQELFSHRRQRQKNKMNKKSKKTHKFLQQEEETLGLFSLYGIINCRRSSSQNVFGLEFKRRNINNLTIKLHRQFSKSETRKTVQIKLWPPGD